MNIYNFIYRFKNYVSLSLAYTKSLFYYIGSFSWFKEIELTNVTKILILKQGGLGDTIICYDFLKSIKTKFKDANINLYCNPEFFKYFKDLDINLVSDLNKIKETDIIFDLSPKKENKEIYSSIKHRCLFLRNPIISSDYFTNKVSKVFLPLFNKHITDYYSQILKELKIKEIKSYRKTNIEKYIILNIVAAKKIRYVPESLAINLINYLDNQHIDTYLIYYGPEEKQFVQNLLKKTNTKHTKLVDLKTKDVSELIKNAKCIITTDTGIAHVSGHYNKQNIVIFGPGSKTIWKPLGKETYVVNSTGCQGCQRHSDTWKCNHECLENIKLKDIISKINV